MSHIAARLQPVWQLALDDLECLAHLVDVPPSCSGSEDKDTDVEQNSDHEKVKVHSTGKQREKVKVPSAEKSMKNFQSSTHIK